MSRHQNLAGKKFGLLTAISKANHVNSRSKTYWLCRCDCGKEVIVRRDKLLKPNPNCGCQTSELIRKANQQRSSDRLRLPPGVSARNAVVRGYKDKALRRNLDWELTDAQLDLLFNGGCYYCGSPPTNRYENRGARATSVFTYNGIDRRNSFSGYTIGNCVSCCYECNKRKTCSSDVEFLHWIQRAYKHCSAQNIIRGNQDPVTDFKDVFMKSARLASRPDAPGIYTRNYDFHNGPDDRKSRAISDQFGKIYKDYKDAMNALGVSKQTVYKSLRGVTKLIDRKYKLHWVEK